MLIVTASNGENLNLAQQLNQIANLQGVDSKVIDLSNYSLPLYTTQQRAKGIPSGIEAIAQEFNDAQTMIFCAPEYNGSIPPALANVIAWISVLTNDYRAPFNEKLGALATHSGGHGQKLLMAMRMMLTTMGMNLIGREIQTNPKRPFQISDGEAVIKQLRSAHI